MGRFLKLVMLMVIATFVSCTSDDDIDKPTPPSFTIPFYAEYDITDLTISNSFSSTGISKGQFTSLKEVSGIAQSKKNKNYLWAHEDSDSKNEIYLFNRSTTQVVATYKILGSENIDWEDMAIATGPTAGIPYVYLADIGDNNSKRSSLKIYRFEEPFYLAGDSGMVINISTVDSIEFVYPDGAKDAEALMVDPNTNNIFIVSKREQRNNLYRLSFPQSSTTIDTLEYMGSFPFSAAVAADISEDGSKALIKTYTDIYYWKKTSGETMVELLASKPQKAPYNPVEPQGEAICWSGNSYYTLSEKLSSFVPKLYFYQGQ